MFVVALAVLLQAACLAPLPAQEAAAPADAAVEVSGSESAPPPPQNTRPAAVESAPAVALPTPTPSPAAQGGPTPEQQALLAKLESWGTAPQPVDTVWFNAAPLHLADLRGQVVIVEFWTFGCINCRNVIPALQEWYAKYHAQGLEIVAVHTPEFSYEKDPTAVEEAIAELGVTWPVVMDNDWQTWRSYNNRFWPAMYLVDKAGHIRHLKIGEGQYAQTEAILQALLAEGL
jgi:thiol-disulfide isomerase/thioredoxin